MRFIFVPEHALNAIVSVNNAFRDRVGCCQLLAFNSRLSALQTYRPDL